MDVIIYNIVISYYDNFIYNNMIISYIIILLYMTIIIIVIIISEEQFSSFSKRKLDPNQMSERGTCPDPEVGNLPKTSTKFCEVIAMVVGMTPAHVFVSISPRRNA